MDSNSLALSYTQQPMSVYIIKANIYCLLIAFSLMGITTLIDPIGPLPSIEFSFLSLLERLVMAPLLYTCAMLIVFVFLTRYVKNDYYLALIVGVGGALVHLLTIPAYMGVVFAFFFVVSLAYQGWDLHSRAHAVFVTLVLNSAMHVMLILYQAF